MKKILKINSVLALSAALLLTSCNIDERFAEVNKNNNEPTVVTPDVLLTNIEKTSFSSHGGFGDGFIGQFAQHFAGNHATGIEYDTYLLTNGSFSGIFNESYTGSLKDAERIVATSPAGYEQYKGVAKILMAYRYGYLTALYGDIPMSEALQSETFMKPKYDSQETVYAGIQKLLTEAVADLDKGTVALKGDFLYNGDKNKWKGVAYLLSARYHNHFSKKDPAGSAAKALAAVDEAKKVGMNSTDWDLLSKFEGTANSQNPWVGLYLNGMVIANKSFIEKLVSTKDPRLENLFASKDRDGENVYGIGKRQSGKIADRPYSIVGGQDSYYGQDASSIPAASYAELLMIEAEAALRANNAARAATAYNLAVTTHVNQVTSHADGLARKAAYLAANAAETATTITLEKIMTQKHIIMIAMSVESWMDFRRHDNKYPTFASIPLNETESAPVSSKFIQRILYPQSELNQNKANVPAATIYDKLPILK